LELELKRKNLSSQEKENDGFNVIKVNPSNLAIFLLGLRKCFVFFNMIFQ